MHNLTENDNDRLAEQELYKALEIKFAEHQRFDEKHNYLANDFLKVHGKNQMLHMMLAVQDMQTSANQLMMAEGFNKNKLQKIMVYLTLWLANMHHYCQTGLKKDDIATLFIKALIALQNNATKLKEIADKHFYHQLTKLSFLEMNNYLVEELADILLLYTDIDKSPKPVTSADEWSVHWCKLNLSCQAYRYIVYRKEDPEKARKVGKQIWDYVNKLISLHGALKHTCEPDALLWCGMIRLEYSQFLSMYTDIEGNCLDFTEKNKEPIKKYTALVIQIHKKHIVFIIELIKNSPQKNTLFRQLMAQTTAAIHANTKYLINVRNFFKEDKNFRDTLEKIINNFFTSTFVLLDITKNELLQVDKSALEFHYQYKKQFDDQITLEKDEIIAEKNRLAFQKSLDIKTITPVKRKQQKPKKQPAFAFTDYDEIQEEKSTRYVINPTLLPPNKNANTAVKKTKPIVKNTPPPSPVSPQHINMFSKKNVVTTYSKKKIDISEKIQQKTPVIKPTPPLNMEPTNPWKKPVTDNLPVIKQQKVPDKTSEIQAWNTLANISKNQLEMHLTTLNAFICKQIQHNGFLCDNDLQQFDSCLHQLHSNDYETLCNAYEFFSVEQRNLSLNSHFKSAFLNIKIAMSSVHKAMDCLQANRFVLQNNQIPLTNINQKINLNINKILDCLNRYQVIRNNLNTTLLKKNMHHVCAAYPLPVRQVFDVLGKNAYLVGSTLRNIFENAPSIIGKDLDFILCIHNEEDIQRLLKLGFKKNINLTHIDLYSALLDLPGYGPILVEVVCIKYAKNMLENDAKRRDFTTAIYGDFYETILDVSKMGFHAINEKIIEIPGNAAKRIAKDPVLMLRIINRLLSHEVLAEMDALALKNWSPDANYSLHKSHINATAKKYMDHWGDEAFTKKLHEYDLLTRLFGITHQEDWEKTVALLKADIATTAPSYLRTLGLYAQGANNLPVDESIPLKNLSQPS